ncbi:hypothetical protein LI142_21645 [Eubacterium limosum]|uniref:hypothetical protein n=1 Tax=Eubacterium limosum TaxID=1736 RepID=UPI001D05DB52|nr:hypothetical protein [Eubacterium limosum]MCB6572106.1 hypothetical protein [Eubacterium limosum]
MKAKDIKKQLDQCLSFEEFFVKVSEIKVECSLNVKKLKKLRNAVIEYREMYSLMTVPYILDCIDAEIVTAIMSKKLRS